MNITKTLTIKSTITGAEQTAAGLQNIASAQGGVAVASDQATKSTLSSEKALERLQRQLDQSYRAQKQFEQATKDLDRANAQGLVSQQRHLELLDLAAKRYRDLTVAAGDSGRGIDKPGEALNRLRGRLDLAHRAQAEFEKSTSTLDAANKAGLLPMRQHLQLLELATQRYRNVINSQSQLGKTIGLSTGALQNMSFQLNDIVSGLAMGQSPFQIMVQQGGQVLQILQMHEGGILGSLRAIKTAILAIPLPVKLIGTAFAAAGAAAVGFWATSRSNAPTAEQNLEEHARLMKVISSSYEEATDKAHKFFEQSKEVTMLELMRNQTRLTNDLAKEITNVSKALMTVTPSLNDMGENTAAVTLTERFKEFRPEVERLIAGINKGTPDFAAFRKEVALVGTARPELAAVASELLEVTKGADKAAQASAITAAEMRLLAGAATEADLALLRLAGALKGIGAVPVDNFKGFTDAIKEMQRLGGDKGFPGLRMAQQLEENNKALDRGKQHLLAQSGSVEDYEAKLKDLNNTHKQAAIGIRENNKAQAEGVNAYESLIQRTRDRIDELKLEAETTGKTADEVVKLKLQHDAERAAKSAGVAITPAKQLELDMLKEELALRMRLAREAETGRKIFKKAMDESKDAAMEFTQAFVEGMSQGLSATEAMIKALDQLVKKLASEGIKNLFSGDPATMALGAVQIGAAVVIDIFTKEAKAAKAAEDTAKALQKFNDELVKLSNTINGVVSGTIEAQAQAFTDQANALADEAQKAAQQAADASKGFFDEILDNIFGQDPEPVVDVKAQQKFQQTLNDINAFIERESEKFRNTFGASIRSLTAGMGLSAVAQEITRLGDALQAFVKDTATAFGGDFTKVGEATRASQQMLLSIIGGIPAMSEFEKEMLRIDQAAEAVRAELMRLGMGANEAAGAVERQAKAARDMAIAAEQARIATERMNLELRLMRATTDASTLAGALQIQQLEQQIEMQEAIASGSQNIALLEQIHEAERIALVESFHKQLLDEQARAQREQLELERRRREEEARLLEDAQRTLDAFSRSITQFIHSTRTGPGSPLSPQARLAEAQAAFQQQLGIIATGTPQQIREAMNSITSFAQDVLQASQDVFGSGTQGQQIFEDVLSTLEELPAQISVQELILEAIETQTVAVIDQTVAVTDTLSTVQDALISVLNTGNLDAIRASLVSFLPQIDTNTDGLITFQEMQAALGDTYPAGTLRGIFDNLDGNGNGVLEKSELTNQRLNTNNVLTGQSNDILFALQGLQFTATDHLNLMKDQLTQPNPIFGGPLGNVQNNMLTALNKIVYNTAAIANNTHNPSNLGGHQFGLVAQGGWISGGVPNTDSVPLGSGKHLGMEGEFVVRRPVAQAYSRELPQFNATGHWPRGSANDDLINEVRMLQRAVLLVASRVDNAADRNSDGQRRITEEARQQMRRPREHGSRANRAA